MSDEQQPRDEGGRFTRQPDMNEMIRHAAREGWQTVPDVFGQEEPAQEPQAEESAPDAGPGGFGGGITAGTVPTETPPAPPDMNDLLAEAAGVARL